jgi:hypothetical protein
MKKYLLVVLLGLFVLSGQSTFAQKGYEFPDSVKYKKNVIRWNLTPFILWSKKDINISYERVLKPYRSFSVNVGYFELPQVTQKLFDSLEIKNTSDRGGFSLSGDYRFYFNKRNRRMAPDGLYWGAYGSYHYTQFNNDITVLNNPSIEGDLLFGAKLNVISAGVELGYQFIIAERLSIDLIFLGPSLTMYEYKLSLTGDLDYDETNEYIKAIKDVLNSLIPGFDELVENKEASATGANLSLGYGVRYLIQIGYRF